MWGTSSFVLVSRHDRGLKRLRLYRFRVAYDALAQSITLIGSRQLVRVERLSRRRRFVAMSVDVDDGNGLAVTSFARRGVGCTWHDMHVLARRQGRWVLLGGGGGSGEDKELLADRPLVLSEWSDAVNPPEVTEAHGRSLLLSGSAGGVHDSGGGAHRWPWSGRWVSYSDVRASATVESLTIAGRGLAVPWHGRVVVVWTGRRGPLVRARDRGGRTIDEVVLTR